MAGVHPSLHVGPTDRFVGTRPVVGLSACARSIDPVSGLHHVVFGRYVDYVRRLGAVPVLLPALLEENDELADLLPRLDGIVLTGSPSNIGLRRRSTGFDEIEVTGIADRDRDRTTLPLVLGAIAADLPLLGICRGCQEINVALGGDLFAQLHQVQGRLDHRAPRDRPFQARYAPAHELRLIEDSWIGTLPARDVPGLGSIRVNSLHGQGIAEVGIGLTIEATAEDGTVEAIRHAGSSFVLGVQWHIEWGSSPIDDAITTAFRHACMARHQSRGNC